ncbi:MAG: hypothetical protein HYY17_11605 [Planctomycetes bacterium]|nr:hypothetical protein [Planctomycetota bacterium]
MKRLSMTLAALVALAGTAQAQYYQKYEPLKEGNAWTYQNQKWGVDATMKVAWSYYGMHYVEGFFGDGQWLAWSGNTLYCWNATAYEWQPLFRFGAPTGTKYTVNFDFLENVTVVVETKSAIFEDTVIHQKFYNCVRFGFQYNTPIFDAGLMSMTFAPNVGLVETSSQSIAGPVQVVLKYASVNGKEVGLIGSAGLEKGSMSQYPLTGTNKAIVINSQPAWEAFYAKHKPGETAPAVNFAKQTVVAVLAGVRPTSGYVVWVDLVRWNFPYSGAKVFVMESQPTTIPVLQVLTSPFEIVVLDRKVYSVTVNWKVVAGP